MEQGGVTVIVPFYNEEGRMAPFVSELLKYARGSLGEYEIIFVDDGSKDGSAKLLSRLIEGDGRSRMISYSPNRGKGSAVKAGVENAVGGRILFIDIDGSVKPQDIGLILDALDSSDVAIGERCSGRKIVVQPFLRGFLRRVMNLYINLLFGVGVGDTSCGIKGFRAAFAKELFRDLKSRRWIFDVEILHKARKRGLRIVEIPVEWEYMRGTRIGALDPFAMFWQLILLRLGWKTG